ncbi:PqqD family protein [Actinomadura sp. ATCC 31491]|uniref:PqqD family protein n=1 Tax=Actinomadura luzonensis TaxID=2805427 RepID=A0ABT0FJB9_9ACTN|nr:PqqD family protein [Actinomadura luzonensis]MCK2212412.1 PqqD family protein [Actinomadura luzonensis]
MDLQHFPIREKEVRAYRVDGKTILFRYLDRYQTNEVGGFIVARCDARHTVDDIVLSLMERYEIDRERALGAVTGFLRDMRAKGFLRLTDKNEA